MKAIILFVLFIPILYSLQTNPIVKISSGQIEGRLLITKSGLKAYIFQGIPYAEPPVGPLRFAKPVRKSAWNGTMVCHEFKAACPQNSIHATFEHMDEDCLHANVYQDVQCNETNLCPVLYYIHSGGYEFESATMFDPEVLIENFASKSLIFVTIGYRLGVLGFWSTGTGDAIGNWAMEDMVAGARWIQINIKSFGGDKSMVTIMGYSSAAMAVSLLSMSAKTEGLFQQMVIMSGTSCEPNAMSNNVSDYHDLAVRMKCAKKSDWRRESNYPKIVNCMRKVDPQLLVNEFNMLREGSFSHTDDPHIITLPRNDGPNGLFPYPVKQMMAVRRPIRTLTGTVKNEHGRFKDEFINATVLSVAEMCVKMVKELKLINTKKVQRQCVDEYVSIPEKYKEISDFNDTRKNPYSYWTERTVELYEDVRYYAPAHKEVGSLVSKGATVYLYSFDFSKTGEEFTTPYHGYDLIYIIGLHTFEFDDRDKKIQSLYLPLFVNFTKYGNPTTEPLDGVVWAPVTSNPTGFNYLRVDIPLEMEPDYHKRGVIFWNYKVPLIENNIPINFKSFRSSNRFMLILIAMGVISSLCLTLMGIYLNRHRNIHPDEQMNICDNQNVPNYDTFKIDKV